MLCSLVFVVINKKTINQMSVCLFKKVKPVAFTRGQLAKLGVRKGMRAAAGGEEGSLGRNAPAHVAPRAGRHARAGAS